MALNLLKLTLILSISFSQIALGDNGIPDEAYLTVGSVEIHEITTDSLNQQVLSPVYQEQFEMKGMDKVDNLGEVIAIGRGLVALGEEIYALVNKGRPVVKTSYAPISVLPMGNDKNVSILETDSWQMPSSRSYQIVYKNLYGFEVVNFRYSVTFSYGGKYQGRGAYITGAQIVPVYISVLPGYTFSANMKLASLQNYGSSLDPVAGIVMNMEYSVETIMRSMTQVDSYLVTGRGVLKSL